MRRGHGSVCHLVLAVALLAGCAALTVDVDVYKGPLANDEEVQLEQVAAMAMGAKPLLIELRDTLEKSSHERLPWQREGCYRAGFMAPDSYQFASDAARQVNWILYLYEDQKRTPFQQAVQAALSRLDALVAAWQRFRPGGTPAAVKAWSTVTAGLAPDVKDELEKDQKVTPLGRLARGYRALVRGEGRAGEREIREAHKELRPLHGSLSGWTFESEESGTANYAFEQLQQPKLVAAHAALLMPGDSAVEARETLVAVIPVVARAFHETRVQLVQMFFILLDVFEAGIREKAWETPVDAPRRELVVEWILRLVHPLRLAGILELVGRPSESPTIAAYRLRAAFKAAVLDLTELEAWRDARTGQFLDRVDEKPSPLFQRVEEFLRRSLREQPLMTARALRDLQHAFVREESFQFTDTDRVGLPKSFRSEGARRYGLVAGPTAELQGVATMLMADRDAIARKVEEFVPPGFDTGIHGGRPASGLEHLIEAFAESESEEAIAPARDRLHVSLIHFAEKLLFVADNKLLLGSEQERPESKCFRLVLQAIGNSILTVVDDLWRRDRHRRDGCRQALAEAHAIALQLGTHLPGLEQRVAADSRPAERRTRAGEVLDELLRVLELEYVAVLKTQGADNETARRLREAIEFTRRRASAMVYLRPSMLYLRNSFPTTSLPGEQRGRGNMLSAATWGAIWPFGDGDPNQQLRDDLDAQFWQNINRIKLSGGGDTNYVLAKDDVGNWYVKAVETDPARIYQSMSKLAKFTVGAANPSMLAGLETVAGTQPAPGGGPAPAASDTGTRVTQLNEALEEHAVRQRTELGTIVRDQLGARIQAAWAPLREGTRTEVLGVLQAPEPRQLLDRIASSDLAGVAASVRLVDDLRSLNLWRARLEAGIAALTSLDPAERERAVRLANSVVVTELSHRSRAYREVLAVFRDSLAIVAGVR
jgi:hypothetical protein